MFFSGILMRLADVAWPAKYRSALLIKALRIVRKGGERTFAAVAKVIKEIEVSGLSAAKIEADTHTP
jgi:hypothetical protein